VRYNHDDNIHHLDDDNQHQHVNDVVDNYYHKHHYNYNNKQLDQHLINLHFYYIYNYNYDIHFDDDFYNYHDQHNYYDNNIDNVDNYYDYHPASLRGRIPWLRHTERHLCRGRCRLDLLMCPRL
jgi:hypothetical protein